jgi:hypothetical protein
VLDVVLWVPIKVFACCLRLILPSEEAMVDLANLTNQAIDDYLKEHPT